MKFLYICIVITIFLGDHANAWRRRRRYRPPPPKNCKLSPWSSWSACNHECGNAGVQIRTRYKIEQECCGGTCGSLKETRPCNRVACRNGGTPLHGRCSCRGGYTGTCCETDICFTKPCQHRCINYGYTYYCQCDPCFTKVGSKCEIRQCQIGWKCYGYNEVNPANQCQYCKKGHPFAWTNKLSTSPCNDGNPCTKNDRCTHGVCKGTPFSCKWCERCDGNGCKRKYGYLFIHGKCRS